ncbi:MAG: replicative DNA helicase [Candidatus Dojkabacteria bacterium]|nr:replicative DNA helicase [Candidatus Dojkabacteria bacterium]
MADIKLPPQNIEAERAVIGAMLLDEEAVVKVMDFLKPDHFYDPKHEIIFESILELFEHRKSIDVLTLTNVLKRKKLLKKIGGVAYLSDIVNSVPSSTHIEEYGHIVKEKSVRRELISAAAYLNEIAFDEREDLDKLLDGAEQKLFEVTEDSVDKDFVHVSKLLERAYERAEQADKFKDKIQGVKSGFQQLDAILGGFQPSDLIILAARPSVGKTALALDMARHIATKVKKNVGLFSLEMSNMQLMDRILSMQVNVGLWDLRMGKLKDEAFERLADAMGVLSESGLFIDDTPGLHIMEMRTKARRLTMEHKVDMIIVDYLQLMQGRTRDNRVQEVSEISMFLKNLARELNVPVLALSQLSRAVESRTTRIPQLSDLRESGSIEQDADVVVFIHREEQYNPETDRKGIADLIIAKHRNGPTGQVELYFVKEQARFRELEKRRDAEERRN